MQKSIELLQFFKGSARNCQIYHKINFHPSANLTPRIFFNTPCI
jgi:hypothetical protein